MDDGGVHASVPRTNDYDTMHDHTQLEITTVVNPTCYTPHFAAGAADQPVLPLS